MTKWLSVVFASRGLGRVEILFEDGIREYDEGVKKMIKELCFDGNEIITDKIYPILILSYLSSI